MLLKPLFRCTSTLACIASLVFFQGTAFLVVLSLKFFKFLGVDMKMVLKGTAGVFVEEISKVFCVFKKRFCAVSDCGESIFDCAASMCCCTVSNTAVAGIMECMKKMFLMPWKSSPEFREAAKEMLKTIVVDFVTNYQDAVEYVLTHG